MGFRVGKGREGREGKEGERFMGLEFGIWGDLKAFLFGMVGGFFMAFGWMLWMDGWMDIRLLDE